MAPDKLIHLKLGVLLALTMAGIAAIAIFVGPGFAVAAGSIAMGGGMEWNQKLRNQGTPCVTDAFASAAAGIVGGLGFEAWFLLLR